MPQSQQTQATYIQEKKSVNCVNLHKKIRI